MHSLVYIIGGTCKEGSVRLSGGMTNNEGQVEVCPSGQRGVVCDDGWDNRDAMVICRQLGFSEIGEKGGGGGGGEQF